MSSWSKFSTKRLTRLEESEKRTETHSTHDSCVLPTQSCKSGRTFRVRPALGLSLSKCFGPILGLHTTFLQHSGQRFFSFTAYIRYPHSGDFCEGSDCDFSSANSSCKHSCVLLFSARISHTFFLRRRHS